MITFFADTFHLLKRHTLTTLRIPIWIFVSIVQPIFYLVIFGQLFSKVVEIPGFAATSYLQFLTPGVVIMTAMFGSFWSGMGLIEDLNEGVVDRMLVTPIHRGAIIASRVLHSSLTVGFQSIILLVVALIMGARFPGGAGGLLVVLILSGLLGAGFSALSNGLAVLLRRDETLIAVINFFGLPLTFLSTAFMASEMMPGWIRAVAQVNPVNWAVNASRDAISGVHWGSVFMNVVFLLIFVLAAVYLATQAFRVYRRSA